MITLLENALERADGSYINPQDLQALDQTIAAWQIRRQTYDLVQAKESTIVAQVMGYIDQAAPTLPGRFMEDGTDRCQRDMTLVLRYCATAMLLQDEDLLKERFLYWMQNIMGALRRQKANDRLYKLLQQVIQEQLPPQNANLLLPYLVTAHQWLSQ